MAVGAVSFVNNEDAVAQGFHRNEVEARAHGAFAEQPGARELECNQQILAADQRRERAVGQEQKAARSTGDEDGLKAALPEAQAEFTAARQRDNYATAYIYACQSVGLVRKVVPAALLVRTLMGDAEAVLRANMDGLIS